MTLDIRKPGFTAADGRAFPSPEAVVDDASLDPAQKRSILQEWRARVSAENRSDGIASDEHTLDRAIERLAGLRT